MEAPKSAPTSAWEEELGIAKYQVNRLQIMAPTKAIATI